MTRTGMDDLATLGGIDIYLLDQVMRGHVELEHGRFVLTGDPNQASVRTGCDTVCPCAIRELERTWRSIAVEVDQSGGVTRVLRGEARVRAQILIRMPVRVERQCFPA